MEKIYSLLEGMYFTTCKVSIAIYLHAKIRFFLSSKETACIRLRNMLFLDKSQEPGSKMLHKTIADNQFIVPFCTLTNNSTYQDSYEALVYGLIKCMHLSTTNSYTKCSQSLHKNNFFTNFAQVPFKLVVSYCFKLNA